MDFKTILLTYVLPLLAYGAVTGLANLILSHRSQVEAWAELHPKAAAAQKLLRAIGLDPFNLIAAVSLWAKGKLPDAQQNGAKAVAAFKMASVPPERMFPSLVPDPLSEDAIKTPKDWSGPSGGLVLLLAVAFAWHSTGCAPAKPPCDQAKMAVIVAECTARSQDCVNKGIAKDQCPSLDDCDSQIEKACQ